MFFFNVSRCFVLAAGKYQSLMSCRHAVIASCIDCMFIVSNNLLNASWTCKTVLMPLSGSGISLFFLENLETQMSGNSAIVRGNSSVESRVREDRKSSSVGKKLEKSWDVLLGKMYFPLKLFYLLAITVVRAENFSSFPIFRCRKFARKKPRSTNLDSVFRWIILYINF